MATVYRPELAYVGGAFREGVSLAVSDEGFVVADAGPSPRVVELKGRALLPGMVNAHSHAFQRVLRGRTEYVAAGRASDDFWSWRELMYRAAECLSPDELYAVSRQAFLEMALAGITAVGEFHYLHHDPNGRPYADRNELARQVIRAARDVGLRIVLLRVGYARSGFEQALNPRQRRFIDPDVDAFLSAADELAASVKDPLVTVGLAPHSVRAVGREWLEAVSHRKGVVHMHVSEQPAETEQCLSEHGRTPVALLSELGLLRKGFTAVHAIHLTPVDVELLGRSGATVCACPSTERNLGDGVVPADELVRCGVPLSLGSDSQAHIGLLEEARQLEQHLRLVRRHRAVLDPGGGRMDGLAERLFSFATNHGADCLGLQRANLTPGAPADFFTVDLSHPSVAGAFGPALLPAIVFGAERSAIRDVAVQGRLIVRDGRHRDDEPIRRAFVDVCRRIAA